MMRNIAIGIVALIAVYVFVQVNEDRAERLVKHEEQSAVEAQAVYAAQLEGEALGVLRYSGEPVELGLKLKHEQTPMWGLEYAIPR